MLLSKQDDIVINEALRQFHEAQRRRAAHEKAAKDSGHEADKNAVKMEYSRGKTRAKINKNIED